MKFFIAAMMSLVVASATAQVSPVSVALTVGQWVLKDTKRVYQVRVEATGRDSADARQNAFRKATELAVGSLVVSSAETRNDALVKNDIISYSSGYIDDFKIIRESSNSVTMDVWVSESKIASRIENMGRASGAKVDGGGVRRDWDRRIAQEETAEVRRQTGNRLNDAVLADYPRAAYKVTVGGTSLVKLSNGVPALSVRVKIEFDDSYAAALAETLVRTRSGTYSGRNGRDNGDLQVERGWANFTMGYWNDNTRRDWIATFNRPVSLELSTGDANACWPLTKLDGQFFGFTPSNTYVVNARASLTANYNWTNMPYMKMTNSGFVTWVSSLNKVEARVVDTNSCGK
jgi:hypothetical protein